MVRLFVTRPREDAEPFVQLCQARGFEAIHAPLLEIRFLPPRDLRLDGVSALAFTSANGVRAFARLSARRDIPAYAVGPASAAAAHDAGFGDVHMAAGDVTALARLIAASLPPDAGDILHPCARDLAGDLGALLGASLHRLRREIVYAADAAEALPAPLVSAARGGSGVVTFFSPRTAEIFVRLAAGHSFTHLDAAVISPAITKVLEPQGFRRIFTAARPLGAPLLDAIKTGLNA